MEIKTSKLKDQRYRKFYFTGIIVLIFFIVFFTAQFFKAEHLFGITSKISLLEMFAFNTSSPLKWYGLTALSSFFLHYNFLHLSINSILLLILGPQFLAQIKKTNFIILILFIRLVSLAFCFVLASKKQIFLGSSSALLGLFSLWLLKTKKYFLFSITLFILIYSLVSKETNHLEAKVHLFSYLLGVFLYSLKRKPDWI